MSYERYIAERYLLSKRKINFITVITLISIIGLSIGTAALIIVLSVFNGFSSLVTSINVGFDPHIRIEMEHNNVFLFNDSLTTIFQKNSHIKSFSPFISEKAMLVFGPYNRSIIIKGVDDKTIGEASGVKDKIVNGSFQFVDSKDIKSIVIGLTLSDKLGALKDDTTYVISSVGLENSLTQFSVPKVLKFKIVGLFESDNKEYDSYYGYISLSAARDLFNIINGFRGIEIRLDDIINSDGVKNYLQSNLPKSYIINTWYDLHKDLYSIMKIERWIAYIILCLIIAVATFNLLGSLTMTVIEKKRDIGVLKAMGSSKKSIVRIFMLEGLLVGIVGTILGCLLGLIICFLQKEFSLVPLDPTRFIISAIPVEIRGTDFLVVAGASLLLSFLATLYPAHRAGNLIPIESIRWE
jgi:lipoprotein-releasing system permease protein